MINDTIKAAGPGICVSLSRSWSPSPGHAGNGPIAMVTIQKDVENEAMVKAMVKA